VIALCIRAIALFVALLRRAIALSKRAQEQKWAKNEQFSKSHIFRSLSIWTNAGQSLIRSYAHLLNLSSLIFKRAIVRSLTQSLFKKRANERSLFSSLFAKERMSNRSFKKRERAKMNEKWAIFQIAPFSLKIKEQSLIFKKSEWPTLHLVPVLVQVRERNSNRVGHQFAWLWFFPSDPGQLYRIECWL